MQKPCHRPILPEQTTVYVYTHFCAPEASLRPRGSWSLNRGAVQGRRTNKSCGGHQPLFFPFHSSLSLPFLHLPPPFPPLSSPVLTLSLPPFPSPSFPLSISPPIPIEVGPLIAAKESGGGRFNSAIGSRWSPAAQRY